MTVVTVIVAELVLLDVLVNICIVLMLCWLLCGSSDSHAGKAGDRCFIAGDAVAICTVLYHHCSMLKREQAS